MFFIWWFLLLPHDLPVCNLWVSQAPTQAQMVQACGTWPDPNVQYLEWKAIDLQTGYLGCSGPATELPNISCAIPLDHYRIVIYWPSSVLTAVGCSVKLDHEGEPTYEEAYEQCPNETPQWKDGKLLLRLWGTVPFPDPKPTSICVMPKLSQGPGLLDLPENIDQLATRSAYELLAGALLWNGLARPDCGSYSGLNTLQPPSATPCGMNSALPHVLEWQNSYDRSIYDAGLSIGVPPRLLKRMIAVESQFWPGWRNIAGETGLLQITDDAADIALRYSPALYDRFCRSNCIGYDLASDIKQATMKKMLLESDRSMQMNAQIVAAYYCYANELTQQIEPSDRWNVTLAVWNAGAACVSSGNICPEGQRYIDEVTK
jgi:hypothetical protein